jgi:outer membrane protein assembly factor BamB
LLCWSLVPGAENFRASAADQPQWGQAWSRNMVSEEKSLPDSFDPKTGKNIKWSAKLGTETHSTPIVAGGRVYIGTNNGEPRDPKHQGDRGVLMCFEEKTGNLLWQFVVTKREEDPYFDWPKTGMSSPVTVEGDRVYLTDNRGEVVCLDAQGMANGNDGPFRHEGAHMTPPKGSGSPPKPVAGAEIQPEPLRPPVDGTVLEPGPLDADIVWLFDLPSGAGIWPHDGAHSSILIRGDHLYVNTATGVDNTHKRIRAPNAPSLVVIDKRTGDLVARDDEHIAPDIFHCTWSSPSSGEVNGQPLIFFAGGNGVLYAFEAIMNPPLTPPRRGTGDRVSSDETPLLGDFGELSRTGGGDGSPGASGRVQTLKKVFQFDFDPTAPKGDIHQYLSNRREGPSNFYGMPVFYRNRIYLAGGGDVFWGKNEAWLKCIDATKTGDITTNGLLWSYPLQKHVMSTPAIYNGMVFIADCGRTFHCLDAETGKPYWTEEIKGDVWASPLVADGKVYLGTRSGDFYVFAASKEKKVLASLELGNPISATATAANGVLYVATMTRLYALQAGTNSKSVDDSR